MKIKVSREVRDFIKNYNMISTGNKVVVKGQFCFRRCYDWEHDIWEIVDIPGEFDHKYLTEQEQFMWDKLNEF